MKIHKEGYRVIRNSFFINGIIVALLVLLPLPLGVKLPFISVFVIFFAWTLFFFRVPIFQRKTHADFCLYVGI